MIDISAIYQGKLSTLDQIKVSPMSRAYTFSDSIYEVIPYFLGKPLCFKEHFDRMTESVNQMNMNVDFKSVRHDIEQLESALADQDGYIYYQISRGIDVIRSHLYQDNLEIERFGYAIPSTSSSSPISAMLCDDDRWGKCNIKSTSLLGNVMSMNDAKDKGCEEVIMHKNNFITEGGASNIFFVKDNLVMTPALTNNILPGITRELLIKAIKNEGIDVQEGKYTLEDLIDSESIWLTSSTKGLAEVGEVINTKTKLIQGHELFKKCKDVFTKKFFS